VAARAKEPARGQSIKGTGKGWGHVDENVDVQAALAEIGRRIFKDPDIGGRHTATFSHPVTGALEEADQGDMGALNMGLVEVNGDMTVEGPTRQYANRIA
jgi:hypothetical protein